MSETAADLLLHGQPELAIPLLERQSDPSSRVNLAIAYRWTNRLPEAMDLLTEIVAQHPDNPSAWNSLGMLRGDYGLWDGELSAYRRAFDLHSHQQFALNIAYSLMRMQKFEEAWPYWESGRFGVSWSPTHTPWDGEEPGRLLILAEGGYGDAFLFSRFFQRIDLSRNPSAFMVWDRLSKWNFGLPSRKIESESPEFEFSTSLLSLMAVTGMKSLADIPNQPTLSFPALPEVKGRWGICWGAEENGTRRRVRTLPVEALEPLRRFYGRWVSLYPDAPHTPEWIAPISTSSWEKTASIISGLDLVVTADTAVAHLSCLLGKPTYILIPSRSDWKWFTQKSVEGASPWWPTARIIRNTDPVSWTAAIESLCSRLGDVCRK